MDLEPNGYHNVARGPIAPADRETRSPFLRIPTRIEAYLDDSSRQIKSLGTNFYAEMSKEQGFREQANFRIPVSKAD
jgi:hypothetical protein